tara:strand:+ start:174 stop:539 length:366 start_codon:yes stop_codon:yes gene_type:complete
MIEIPKIKYMNFDEGLKEKLCVYSPENYYSERGSAGWYRYDLDHFLDDGLKKIRRLGNDIYRGEDKLVGKNSFCEIQCVRVGKIDGITKSDLFDVIAYVHYKMLEGEEYEFLKDYGEFRFI